MNKNRIAEYSFYLWLLIWPWQTKLILRSATSNYLEISFFLSGLLLIIPIIIWSYKLLVKYFGQFKMVVTQAGQQYLLPLWLLILITSIFWSEDKILALYRCLIIITGILLFLIIKKTDLVKTELVVKYFLIGLIAPSLLALWQFFTQSTIASKYLGLAYHASNVLGDSVIETSAGRFLRAYGSFDHPNILGGVMVLGIILVLYASLQKEIDRRRRIFYLVIFSIFYLALLVSFSRSAWLALVISVPFILLMAWRRGKFQKKLIILFIFLIIGLLMAVIIPNHSLFLSRTNIDNRLEIKSIDERELYLGQAREMISQKPILGVGVGNYILALQKIIPEQPVWYYQPVHNYWLLIWAELGVFGLIVIILFWFAMFKTSLKNDLWPIVLALFVFSLFDHWLWTQTAGGLIFFLIAGLIFRNNCFGKKY